MSKLTRRINWLPLALSAFTATVVVSTPVHQAEAKKKNKGVKGAWKKTKKTANKFKERKAEIKVVNCTADKVTVCIYDGGDVLKSSAKGRRTLKSKVKWTPKCIATRMGQDTQRCKAYVVSEAGNACPVDVPGNKTILVPENGTLYVGLKDKNNPKSRPVGDVGNKGHCSVSVD
ncbi:MAG: hypothetical protein ACE366_12680 [Bradymonadia bacterium]